MTFKQNLKLFIAGQKKFGADTLKACASHPFIEIVGYATTETDTNLRKAAASLNIKEFDINNLPEFDIGITAHYFGIIPESAIQHARTGWVGYHPSLLPRHRGKNAVKASLNDIIVGGTLYWLNNQIDGGDIAKQQWAWRDYDNPLDLWAYTLAPLGIRLLHSFLLDMALGAPARIRQNEKFATKC